MGEHKCNTYIWFTPWRVKPLTQLIRNYIFALLTTCKNWKSLLNKLGLICCNNISFVALFKCLYGTTSGNVLLREFHNLAPYMEMHIDFVVLVRKRVMQNESFSIVPYIDTYGLKKLQTTL